MGLIGAVWRRLVSSLNPKRCDNANMLKNYPSPGKLAGVSRPPLQRSVGGVSDSSRALCVMSEKFPLKCCIRTTDKQTKNTYSLTRVTSGHCGSGFLSSRSLKCSCSWSQRATERWTHLNLIFLVLVPGVSENLSAVCIFRLQLLTCCCVAPVLPLAALQFFAK